MSIFDRVKNFLGSVNGKIENLVHGPILPHRNYFAVVDTSPFTLARGSWPTYETLEFLKKAGFKTVLNLCSERTQDPTVIEAGMDSENLRIEDGGIPDTMDVQFFLWFLEHHGPLFVHCEAGVGRTGCMIAAYRVKVVGWTAEQALQEAVHYGKMLPRQREFILGLKK